jgi:hypothetical protein
MTTKQLDLIKRKCHWTFPNVDMSSWNESKLNGIEASALIQVLIDMETWRGYSNDGPYDIIKSKAEGYLFKLSQID